MSDGLLPIGYKDWDERTKAQYDNLTDEEKIRMNGVFCGNLIEEEPFFYEAPCEKVFKGKNNSYLVFGRDRVNSLQSGYGGRGLEQASMIDLVVGRLGRNGNVSVDSNGEDAYCNPSFEKDSARIYISQRTDVDNNFKLVDGVVGNSTNRSAIAIKADAVRIIGREGIKLVTRSDVKNSRGGDISVVKGIDLIAGNDDTDLQPIPKGLNVARAMEEMYNQIDILNGFVGNLVLILADFHRALQGHTHPVPSVNVLIPTPAGPAPLANTLPGLTDSSPPVDAGAATAISKLMLDVYEGCVAQKQNIVLKTYDYLDQGGGNYINSRFNRIN